MRGRIYDPILGRFLQADPFIQAPNNTQNYNRYSYVLNNPMSYTDPSGYFFKKLFKAIAKVPVLNAAVQIGLGIACGPICTAAYSAAQGYSLTGSLGAAIKAGAISYATAHAFKAIGGKFTGKGGFFDAGVKNGFNHIMSHALVGGVSSVLHGGKFGHGFLSAGLTKGLTPQFEGIGKGNFDVAGYDVAEATVAGVLGGTLSKLSGGKFANGAITAAMGNLFNAQRERHKLQMIEKSRKKVSGEISKTAPRDEVKSKERLGLVDAGQKLINPESDTFSNNPLRATLARLNIAGTMIDSMGTVDVTTIETVRYGEFRYQYAFNVVDIDSGNVVGTFYDSFVEVDYSVRYVVNTRVELNNVTPFIIDNEYPLPQ